MPKGMLRLFLALMLVPRLAMADARTKSSPEAAAPSFLGDLPDALIVVLRPGVGPLHAFRTAGAAAHVGDSAFDAIADRFAVAAIAPQFPGARIGAGSPATELARYHKVRFEAGSLDDAAAAFRSHPWVESVQPIGLHALYDMPNDPDFATLQWSADQASDHDIDLPEAWDIQTGDTTVVLAILDSGTRYYHPDLGGRDASAANPQAARGNMWINSAEQNGLPGVDDDGNGYVDDWIGYDFVDDVTSCWPGEDCGGKDNDPRDFNGHGTHTAGIAGMLTNDGYGLAGIAGGWGDGSQAVTGNGIRIMALRVGYSYDYDGREIGVVAMDAAAEALYYAANNGARIASCSWGSSNSGGLGAAVSYFIAQGGLVFVAAGNDQSETADYLNGRGDCISIAATDAGDHAAGFTTFGTWVDLSAPGTGIYATFHDHEHPEADLWAARSGTSTAAPAAAAVAALVWSQHPGWASALVRDRLYSSSDNIDAYLSASYIGKMGHGRVNAARALAADLAHVAVADFTATPTAGETPLTVTFADGSWGNIDRWNWSFGDGASSTVRNPVHTYTRGGSYTVSLAVAGALGSDSQVRIGYVVVSDASTADQPLPEDFALDQNFPNPFNAQTTITFSLSRAAPVELAIYSVLGHPVAVLARREFEAGRYTFEWDTPDLPSGVYFCRLRAGSQSATRSMLLLK